MGKDEDLTKDAVNRPKSTSSNESLPSYAPPSYEQASSFKAYNSPVPHLIHGPSKILMIYAGGTRAIRLPTPSRELAIPIFEGTDTSVEPVYISNRSTRRSGNAVLSHIHRGDLYASNYKFGPFRDPVIRHANRGSDIKRDEEKNDEGELAVSIKTHSFSNRIDLTVVNTGKILTWRYGKTELPTGKTRVLVLEESTGPSSFSERNRPRALAVLIRTDDTRTPGTSKWDAGNGGQLVIDAEASVNVDEGLIVAGCLVMLKRETDRQRARQGAAIGAAVS